VTSESAHLREPDALVEPPAPTSVEPPAPTPTPIEPPTSTPAPSNAVFRVATYNINYGSRNLKAITDGILRTNADLIVLQEVTDRAEGHLDRRLRSEYPHRSFHARSWAAGHAVLSRAPLSDVTLIDPEFGPFGALVAETSLGGRAVQIVSVHLKPTLPRRGASSAEVIAQYMTNEPTRHREITAILSALDPALPHIIAGDFNTLPGLGAVADLRAQHYIDSQGEVADVASDRTWRWRWDGREVSLRLDYVFHSPSLATVAAEVLELGPSDHFPVVSTLRWAVSAPSDAGTTSFIE
jgi:endonuclease/exonuclease/phosphatase family metal-dependent hydrolase